MNIKGFKVDDSYVQTFSKANYALGAEQICI
jgi:hypothetical protein